MDAVNKMQEWIELKDSMLLFMGVSLVIPLYWNSLSRFEYYTKRVSGFFGSNVTGCYFLAGTVFNFSLLRNYLYELAVADQVQAIPELMPLSLLSWPLFIAGSVLVLSSMYKLGITGTYNGDYFGIFMKERVTSFPFSVTGNPMYTGSTMIFFSYACYKASFAAYVMSAWVLAVYQIGLLFEEPFTAYIYSSKAAQEKEKLKTK